MDLNGGHKAIKSLEFWAVFVILCAHYVTENTEQKKIGSLLIVSQVVNPPLTLIFLTTCSSLHSNENDISDQAS